jgi:imidazolonepropionase-like amidohydrolase
MTSLMPIARAGLVAACLVAAACGGNAPPQSAGDQPPSPQAGGPVAFTNVTVIDVVSGARSRATVVTSGRRIAAVGQGVPIPRGAARVDGTGKFLIPGLWDMHTHQQMVGDGAQDLLLANGVTGTRDMGSDPDFILHLRDRINRGELLAPEIVAAGPILDALRPEGPITEVYATMRRRVTTAAEGRQAVRDLKRRGVDFVKVHDRTPRDAFFAIAEEARAAGLPVAGHVPLTVTVDEAAASGIRSIEHLANFRVFNECSAAPPHKAIACDVRYERLAAAGVWQTPTLAFMQAIPDLFSGKDLEHADYASEALVAATRDNARFAKFDQQAFDLFRAGNQASLMAIHQLVLRGNGLLAACDGLVPGFCLHDELEWMTKAGLTPLQALQTATLNPARYLGRESSQGTIAAGRRADLVLLDADPLADIRNTRRIAAVVVRGRVLLRGDLDRLLDGRKRGGGLFRMRLPWRASRDE